MRRLPTVHDKESEQSAVLALLLGESRRGRSQVILSARPAIWDYVVVPSNTTVVDVTPLFQPPVVALSEVERQRRVQSELIAAGWEIENIAVEFRPDLKTAVRFDFAILDNRQNPIAIVDLLPDFSQPQENWIALDALAKAGVGLWVGVTDGAGFLFRETATGKLFDRVPMPDDLGIRSASMAAHEAARLLALRSRQDVSTLLTDIAPNRIVIDHTVAALPQTRDDQVSGIRATLFGPASTVETRHLATPLEWLLLWAVSVETCTTATAVLPYDLLSAPEGRDLRRSILTHQSLHAITELPRGVIPDLELTTAIVSFDRAAKEIQFNRFPTLRISSQVDHNREDTVRTAPPRRGQPDQPPQSSYLEDDDEFTRASIDEIAQEILPSLSGNHIDEEEEEADSFGGGAPRSRRGRPRKKYPDHPNIPELARTSAQTENGILLQISQDEDWIRAGSATLLSNELDRFARFGEIVRLDFVCDVLKGQFRLQKGSSVAGGIRVISARAIRNGRLLADEMPIVSRGGSDESALLRSGDVLIPSIYASPFSAVVYEGSFPAVASSGIFVLRPRQADGVARVSSDFLAEFLDSTAGKAFVKHCVPENSLIPHIRVSDLRRLPIPVGMTEGLPSPELRELRSIEQSLNRKAVHLAERRSSLFDAPSSKILEESATALLRQGRILTDSLNNSGRLEYQIANFYPFPIAYGYRLLDSANSDTLLKEQLRVAENILAFLGSVSLALLQPTDRQLLQKTIDDAWRAGISPGHWRSIIAECGKVLRLYKDYPLASALSSLNASSEKGFGGCLRKFVTVKNDFKHDRITDKQASDAATTILTENLRSVMEQLQFLTEFPLRQIEDIDLPRWSPDFEITCLRMVGDHPGLPRETVRIGQRFQRSDVVIDLGRSSGWVSLYPFITRYPCTRCGARETYSIDKVSSDRAGSVALKSFERGHTLESPFSSQDFRRWSALVA